MKDTELEELFRTGLQRHADEADTAVDLLGPARKAARAHRGRRYVGGAVGLAAASLVAAFAVHQTGGETTKVADLPSGPLPAEWRTEVWHGLQIEVPADWAWGSAPVRSGGESLTCGGPDADVPYVGRPVMASDVCVTSGNLEPTAPFVWFDADVEVGDHDYGGGLHATTVELEGTRLTVATRDPRLTDLIVRSAVAVRSCEPELREAPSVDSMLTEGMGEVTGAQVCAYRRDGDEPYRLVYAASLDSGKAEAYHAALYDGTRENDREFCDSRDEMVLVRMTGTDFYGDLEVTQDSVVAPYCHQWSGGPGSVTPMSDAAERTWAVEGLPVTLYSLIGPQG